MLTIEELNQHNYFRRKRLESSKQVQNNPLTTELLHSDVPYFHHILHTRYRLNAILELWFEEELILAEHTKAATLLYNDDEGAIIHIKKGRYGISETKNVISIFNRFKQKIEEGDSDYIRHCASEILKELPYPTSLMIWQEALKKLPTNRLIKMASTNILYFDKSLKNQPKGNARAYRTALALRAAHEYYCKEAITVGTDKKKSDVVGRYCRCLEEVYETVGLNVDVMGYALKAKKCPENDPLLKSYREFFKNSIELIGKHPFIYSKFGWVENMTFQQKLINLIAVKCNKLEFLQCYNRPSKTAVYTQTQTKSLMLSPLAQNVHNGAIKMLARLF